MTEHAHPLFQRYPLGAPVTLSTGPAPTPYHIYDGYGVFVGGTADAGAVGQLLASESVVPALTAGGRALMGIWVCDFTDASLGPHHELQFSIFVTRRPAANVPAHPLGLAAALLVRPDIEMLCHGLWNNTPPVVAYNREVLSLDARLANSEVVRAGGQARFRFADVASGRPLLSGALGTHNSMGANWALGRLAGFRRLMRIARQPWVSVRVVNPRGVRLDRNATAAAFSKNDRINLRLYDPRRDTLDVAHTLYGGLRFAPQYVQFMEGFKFVYLEPQ